MTHLSADTHTSTIANPEGRAELNNSRRMMERIERIDRELAAQRRHHEQELAVQQHHIEQVSQQLLERIEENRRLLPVHTAHLLIQQATLNEWAQNHDPVLGAVLNAAFHGGNILMDIETIRTMRDDGQMAGWLQSFGQHYGVRFCLADEIEASPERFIRVLNRRASVTCLKVWRRNENLVAATSIRRWADLIIRDWQRRTEDEYRPGLISVHLMSSIEREWNNVY